MQTQAAENGPHHYVSVSQLVMKQDLNRNAIALVSNIQIWCDFPGEWLHIHL